MRIRFKTFISTCTVTLLSGVSLAGFSQNQVTVRGPVRAASAYMEMDRDLLLATYVLAAYGYSPAPSVALSANDSLASQAQSASGGNDSPERRRAVAQALAILAQFPGTQTPDGIQAHADPEAPDQSQMLKNSKDHDFILHNFRTMYVDASEARYFGSEQMKAALGGNKEFQKLNVRIVDDPRLADVVLFVSYTFAWDYPFELRHQNTSYVLLAGKGEGPFSGPLGATDVARQFVNLAKPWRETKKAENKSTGN